MHQPTYNVIIPLEGPFSGRDVIDGVEQIVAKFNTQVRHKVTFQKRGPQHDPENEGPFILGQSSEHPWEDFVLSPSRVGVYSFDPDGNYRRLVVSHVWHYWDDAKKEDDDTDKMLLALRSFADAITCHFIPALTTV